ncbi:MULTISPECIES: 50S ribosomal protein L4 [Deferrisoma]
METPLVNAANEEVGRVDLPEEIFGAPVNEALLWEVVRMQTANRRRGTHATKTRSEVAGSGRKLWVQKGTGRARVGDRRNPLWKGGGTVHGPQPRSYAYSMPKKKRRLALRSALAAKARDGELLVVESLGLEGISTKQLAARLKALGAENALIVVAERDEVVEKSARNLPQVKVLRPEGLNVYDILRYEKLVLLQGALERIQERV